MKSLRKSKAFYAIFYNKFKSEHLSFGFIPFLIKKWSIYDGEKQGISLNKTSFIFFTFSFYANFFAIFAGIISLTSSLDNSYLNK